MPFFFSDRVWETTNVSGGGVITLAGATTGYTSFASGFPPANSGDVCANVFVTDGTLWEELQPTYTSGKLTKIVISSCSGLSGIVWSSTVAKDVFVAPYTSGLKAIGGSAVNLPYTLASGAIGTFNLASGSVTSGAIASGQIGQFHHSSGSVTSGAIASGQVSTFHIASGGVLSGNIASGQIGQFHLASGSVTSGAIASGQIGHFHIASGAIQSGQIGTAGTPNGTLFLRDDFTWAAAGGLSSGAVISGYIGNNAVVSGSIASGQISAYKIASGYTPQFTGPFISGSNWTATTEETVSGLRAVQLSPSGNIRIAMATVSGRQQAMGIVYDNVASGIQVNVYTQGVFQATSGMTDYSGYIGKVLYAGRSGHIVTTSGSFNSGGFVSGDIWTPVGFARNSGACVFNIAAQNPFTFVSG